MSNRVRPDPMEVSTEPGQMKETELPSDGLGKIHTERNGNVIVNGFMEGETTMNPPVADAESPEATRLSAKVEQEDASTLEQILVSLLIVGLSYIFIVLFSAMVGGYGDKVYLLLASQSGWVNYFATVSGISGVSLFIADAHQWHGCWKVVARILTLVVVVGMILTCLLVTKSFPAAPMGVYLLLMPSIFMALKYLLYPKQALPTYLRIMIKSLVFVSVVSLTVWVVWLTVYDRWWNNTLKYEYYPKVGCANRTDVFNDSSGELVEELQPCSPAFLMWLSPLILSVWSFVFALVLHFLVRAYHQSKTQDGKITVDPLLQFFLSFVILGIIGVWAAAGIAGAEMGVSNVVLALSTLGLIVSGAVVLSVFGWTYIGEQVKQQPLGHRLVVSLQSDWARSLLFLLAAPVFLVYIFISVLTQFARKYFRCTKTLNEKERQLIVTKQVYRMILAAKQWNWASVLVKIMWWGIAFFLLMVGVGRAVTVFMSFLNESLASTSLAVTTVIFYAVGLVMFLLPPVPGLPVYIAGGVILTNNARDEFTFWGAVVFTVFVCFSLKLLAICLQQKVIGERLGTSIRVRQFVGINSLQIRAVRSILQEPGIKLDKIFILIGGPDWPTSVLTGILRLSLTSMICGSLPVFFLIAPTCVAGAMLLRTGDGSFWASIASISLAISFVVQSGSLLAAMHFIEKRARDLVDEEFELDEEVHALEQKVAVSNRLHNRLMRWSNIGAPIRFLIFTGSISMAFSCYIFQLFGSSCFKSFKTTDSIDVVLDGNPLNIVQPMGVLALSLFGYGSIALAIINQYAKMKVKGHSSKELSLEEETKIVNQPLKDEEDFQFLTSWAEVFWCKCC